MTGIKFQYDELMNPLLKALKLLGGSGTNEEINAKVAEVTSIPAEELEVLHNPKKGGMTEFEYRLMWTRTYLKKFGVITNSSRGVWALTPKGNEFESVDIREVVRTVREQMMLEKDNDFGDSEVDEPSNTIKWPIQPTDPEHASNLSFDAQSFHLLEGLHRDPTQAYYNQYKSDFKQRIEQPFQHLMKQAVKGLRREVLERMETEDKLFSRFNKNDFGRKGAWDFYWGALYPKGGKRTSDPQLSLAIFYDRLEIGFYFGNSAAAGKARFAHNCRENQNQLMKLLSEVIADNELIRGGHQTFTIHADGTVTANNPVTWDAWFDDPGKYENDISLVVPKERLLQMPLNDQIELVTKTYNRLYPFVILAASDNPMAEIIEYLGGQQPPDPQPTFTLAELQAKTGMEIDELEKWLRAIERKQQVIIYGPPGTGKTFTAKLLAKHLIGSGDGFMQLVQFHPEVAYEDFVQGIRPQTLANGGLSYPLVSGRFMEFCNQARKRQDTCVLIIDEINRANLARVFGELMYLLEYRDQEIELAGGKTFSIPKNVRIIGTMNTADRSIALVDHALRRRFALLALYPNYQILRNYHQQTGFQVDGLVEVLQELNQQIADRHYALGTSYFLRPDIADHIADIWQMEVEPYLEEYFFDQPEKYQRFCWDSVSGKVTRR